MGVATTTVTATSFETATSTITSVAEITSVATTCTVGTTAPTLVQYYLSSCTESVWSSAGQYWQQYCSASLVGGTVVRAYAYPVEAYNLPVSICAALNSLNIPASKCAGINVVRAGGIAEYLLVNGDLSVTSTTTGYTNNAIALYKTNPCEITATATTTNFYPVAETSAVVYTSTYEVTYVETITVSIADTSTSSSATTGTSSSTSPIPFNTTSSAAATTIIHPLANATSTLSFVPVSNMTRSSIVLSTSNTSLIASTQPFVPIAVNATTTSSIVLSTHKISSNVTTQTLVPVAVNASNITAPIAVLPVSTATIINTSSSNYSSTRPLLSSIIPNTTSSFISTALNTTISALISSSTSPSPLFLNTTSSNIQATTSSSPMFQNNSSSNSACMPYLTSSASVVIAVPTLSTSASAQIISPTVSSHEVQAPVTLTRYITDVYTVTACPPKVPNCPAFQKSTLLATKTIVTYLTMQAASPTHVAQTSEVHASETGSMMNNALSTTTYTTSTLYSTMIQTVTACPSSVEDCPASGKTVYQSEVVKAYTTICPVAASSSETVLRATSSIVPAPEVSPTSSDISITRYTTSILYSTYNQTMTACPSSVKHCPASEKTVYQTEIIKAYTTVCPVASSSSEGGLQATSSIISPVEASPSSIASSSVSITDAAYTQSKPVAVSGELSDSSILSSKIISGSEVVAVLTVGGTRTYTVDGKTMASTRGFSAISVASSSSSSSATTEAVAPTVESSSSIIASVSSSSDSLAVSVYSPAVYSKSVNATIIVMPNRNSSAVAISTAKSSAAISAVTSPSTALYTGAASASKLHTVSLILGVVFALLGFFFTTF
ncbi:hypothetical protein KCU68_g793, partial [Aureobasidium melanogenum]